MAGRTAMRSRTIHFFEIVESVDGEERRMDQQDWQGVLGHLARADLDSRTWDGEDRQIIGQVYPLEEVDRLVMHRLRDPGDWMSTVDFNAGEIAEVEERAGTGLLDSSAVQFAGYGNVVGLMQGAISSPGLNALQGWLNSLNPFGRPLVVRPLVTPAELERLRSASEVSRFEIKLGAHQRQALRERGGSLGRWLGRSMTVEDVDITVIFSIPRGKKNSESRRRLAEELNEMADVIPDAAEIARATLYHGPADALSAARVTELVKHNITAKRNVRSVDEEGNSIRIKGAFVVMDTVFYELEDQLRQAADV